MIPSENFLTSSPLDLHVLGTPPAFVLSQDQTLVFNPSDSLFPSSPFPQLDHPQALLPRFSPDKTVRPSLSLRINCRCSLLFSVSFSRFPLPASVPSLRLLALPSCRSRRLGCLNRLPPKPPLVKRFFELIFHILTQSSLSFVNCCTF